MLSRVFTLVYLTYQTNKSANSQSVLSAKPLSYNQECTDKNKIGLLLETFCELQSQIQGLLVEIQETCWNPTFEYFHD